MKEKMSNDLKQAFTAARNEALRCKDSCLRLEHILHGILVSDNIIKDIVSAKVPDYELLINETSNYNRKHSDNDPDINQEAILHFDETTQLVIRICTKNKRKEEYLTAELFFLTSFDFDIAFIKLISGYGVTKAFIQTQLKESLKQIDMYFSEEEGKKGSNDNQGNKAKSKTPILDMFSRDLTVLAMEGKLDPIIGREDEVQRVAQILTRRKKNNPILIGDPGVGKTAIAEGLALKIATNDCPRTLQGKRLVTLDLTSMVAGTKYRGQFEERIKGLLDEVRENPNIILFLDEIHTMVGAGNSSGALDAANVFKPALARGEVQCIGATTLDEYREYIEKDGALDRRFQKVMITPPSLEQTREILSNIREKYQEFHKVTFTDEAIDEIIRLSDRYITNREFPDKAIDVMDEAGSRAQINIKAPQIIKDLEEELKHIKREKADVVKSQDYEKAADLRDQEKKVLARLKEENDTWKRTINTVRTEIDADMICEVVSIMTNIPITRVGENEAERLINIDQELNDTVIGQGGAVKKVAAAIKRNRTGLRRQNRPIGSFMFVGPTGVGKTQLAKVLAKKIFGSEDALIRVDMSEYAEKFNVSKLFGAPPGYIGYNEGGQLTEKVKNKPYSLILLDEVEKAHPDVFDALLQVLDEGHLTDGSGRKINFKNTIIIMTSNIGLKDVANFGTKIGFSVDGQTNKSSQEIIIKSLKKHFKLEFLNRLDEIVYFNYLGQDEILKIVDIQLQELSDRLAESNYTATFSKAAKIKLAELGYDEDYGARELQRVIQKYVEDPMSETLLKYHMPKTAHFSVSHNHKKDELAFSLKLT